MVLCLVTFHTGYYILSNFGLYSRTSLNFGIMFSDLSYWLLHIVKLWMIFTDIIYFDACYFSGNLVTKVQNIIPRWYSASRDMDHSGKGTECVPSALLLKLQGEP